MYKSFSAWYMDQCRHGHGDAALVLHTSCVNYTEQQLAQMEKIPVCWILPHSVRYELYLLAEGTIFRSQACRILRRADADAKRLQRSRQWDLEQLYMDCVDAEAVSVDQIFRGTLVFWFGDLNKQDEFLWNVRRLGDRHSILKLTDWDCSRSSGSVTAVDSVRYTSHRRCQALSRGIPAGPPEELVICGAGKYFPGRELTASGFFGTSANIFESPRFPGKMIKIYKRQAITGNQVRKLERLSRLWNRSTAMERDLLGHLALPEQIIRTDRGDVIGYTMRKCSGRPLKEYRVIGWNGHDQARILRDLLSILLHLHTMRILVNDLSYNNVLVDENDRVSLVDCDSFQVFHFPGGGITELFRHPQVPAEWAAHLMRDPRHEYFSFAVLLFQILFHADPIRPRKPGETGDLNWNNGVFPLDIRGEIPGGPNIDVCVSREWARCPEPLRKLFADEFHFRRDHSLGAWIHALGLVGLDGEKMR